MTHEEKINYMRIACNMTGFPYNNQATDLLVSLYDGILEKKGKFSIDDQVRIEFATKERDMIRMREEKKHIAKRDK